MKTILIIWSMTFLVSAGCNTFTKTHQQRNKNSFTDSKKATSLSFKFEYIGKAVQKKNTHVWGSSPVIGRDGKVHLYVAEWPMPEDQSEKFSGWYKHSHIAHYVGDSPEGPFKFVGIAVNDRDNDFNSPHNPTIQFIDNKFILCFIVNENDDLKKQRIMMLVADDLDDKWRSAKGALADGTILTAPKNSTIWNYNPRLGVSNPSLIKLNNKYMLYYKSVVPDSTDRDNRNKWDYGYGVAISDKLEGPYTNYPKRVTEEGLQLEDAYVFTLNNKIYMLSRDFMGSLGGSRGGLLWVSDDGFYFPKENCKRAFDGLEEYVGKEILKSASVYRGSKEGDLERPQLLIVDGEPRYMYVATGINENDGYGSCSHVFKLVLK